MIGTTRVGLPPWHLWGSTQEIVVPADVPPSAALQLTPGQIARVSYKRPERWSWLFFATISDAVAADANETAVLSVFYDLTVGLGRSSVTLLGFEQYRFTWGPIQSAPIGSQRYSTTVVGPPRFGGAPVTDNFISDIVAQDIQCACRIAYTRSGAGAVASDARVAVSAYFSPATHIRPDWMLEEGFAGDETGGT